MAWLSSDEVVYSTNSETEQMFWRQSVAATPDQRVSICRIKGKTYTLEDLDRFNGKVYWSPDGRMAVMWPRDERFMGGGILSVSEGSVRPLHGHCSQIAWKPDSSALVVQYYDNWDKPDRFELIEFPQWEVTDLTSAFREAFGTDTSVYFDDYWSGGWTPDGRYLLVTVCTKALGGRSDFAGWLVCPKPWQAHRLTVNSAHVLPVPGWILSGRSGEAFAFDYSGKQCIPIGNAFRWTFSPDGRHAASFSEDEATVVVHNLNPPLMPQ